MMPSTRRVGHNFFILDTQFKHEVQETLEGLTGLIKRMEQNFQKTLTELQKEIKY